jgi:hypothetical protein
MAQHKATPIPVTFKYIPGYPKTLRLYQITRSHFWWVRASVNGKMHKRSTKCGSMGEAMRFAQDFYRNLLIQPASSKTAPSLKTCSRPNQLRVGIGERRQSVVDDVRSALEGDMYAFFGKYNVKDITYTVMNGYLASLTDKELSP